MLYGNLKNMTYTQSVGNFNAGVGFFLGLIFRDFYPLKHGRYVNWRERGRKEQAYYRRIRMIMRHARQAGLIKD